MGLIVAAFKPAIPPTVPTPDAVWEGIVATGTDYSWSVPSFIEVMPRYSSLTIFATTHKLWTQRIGRGTQRRFSS